MKVLKEEICDGNTEQRKRRHKDQNLFNSTFLSSRCRDSRKRKKEMKGEIIYRTLKTN